ncbi:MAG: hypothetical protein ACE5HO_00755 [bacterium]
MVKTLLIWTLFFTTTLAGFTAAFYFGRDKILPRSKRSQTLRGLNIAVDDSASGAGVDSLTMVTNELLTQLKDYVTQAKQNAKVIALQKKQIELLRATNDSLRQQLQSRQLANNRIQDLTKTLGAMKVDVLEPILENLPDETIQILYDKAKSKDKEKIFNAVNPKRAGRLLRLMTKI